MAVYPSGTRKSMPFGPPTLGFTASVGPTAPAIQVSHSRMMTGSVAFVPTGVVLVSTDAVASGLPGSAADAGASSPSEGGEAHPARATAKTVASERERAGLVMGIPQES